MGSSVLADDVLEFWYVESDPRSGFVRMSITIH